MADREKGYEAELGEMKKEVQKQSEKSRKKQERFALCGTNFALFMS